MSWTRELRAVWPLLVLLGGVGGFTWLAKHPEAAVVDWALERPFLAPAARAFRARWGPRPEGTAAELSAVAEAAPEAGTPPHVELIPLEARPRVWAPAGTPLYTRPDGGAEVARRLAATRPLPYLARQGDWFQVRAVGLEGWVELPGYDEVANPPLGSGRRASVAGPGRPPDQELLMAAEGLMGSSLRRGDFGPFALLTDVDDEALLARLARLATGLEGAFTERFGLAPRAETVATVVLFRREADYRRFQSLSPQIAGLPSTGHAGGGMVALFAERDGSDEVEASLIHELTHEVSRRAVGPALPPWLAEGLADELARTRWDEAGRPLPGSLSGEERLVERRRETVESEQRRSMRIEERYELTGGRAALALARDAAGRRRLPSLEDLTSLEWRAFVGGGMDVHYAEAFLFIRFLLAEPRRAGPFRTFLADVAGGGSPAGEALRQRLGVSWDRLDADFGAWLAAQSPEEPRDAW
ncbi:MAG: hypothetical protein ACRD2Z_07570 [Thermoanaerobaculia bacterium]